MDNQRFTVSELTSTSFAIALMFNNSPHRTARAVKNLINFSSFEMLIICLTSFSIYVLI